jgi:hypothetical protein
VCPVRFVLSDAVFVTSCAGGANWCLVMPTNQLAHCVLTWKRGSLFSGASRLNLKDMAHPHHVHMSVELGNKAIVASGCIIGEQSSIGDKTSVKRSVIGARCKCALGESVNRSRSSLSLVYFLDVVPLSPTAKWSRDCPGSSCLLHACHMASGAECSELTGVCCFKFLHSTGPGHDVLNSAVVDMPLAVAKCFVLAQFHW